MRNENGINEHQQGFLNTLKQLSEEENKLKSTDSYKLLDSLSELFLERDKETTYIEIIKLNSNNKFASEHYYKDLIDIYFYEKKLLIKTPKDEAIIHIIGAIGIFFNENAFNYLGTYAFRNCEEQIYALKFLLYQATRIKDKKTIILDNIRQNFNGLDEDSKKIVKDDFSFLFPNEKIEFAIIKSDSREYNSTQETQSAEETEKIEKKWWEFWK